MKQRTVDVTVRLFEFEPNRLTVSVAARLIEIAMDKLISELETLKDGSCRYVEVVGTTQGPKE